MEEISDRQEESRLQNVDVITLNGKTIFLVGTAHVSKQSVELVDEVISKEVPDAVTVELCESRYKSLQDPDRWKNMDLYSVIKEGKAYVLMAQLALAAFQKKLGQHLDVAPGAEMMQAINAAKREEINAEIVLADRDIKTTLRRTWSALGLWSMLKVIGSTINGMFTSEKFDEDDIERLKSADALDELMKDFSKALPDVRTALIDERDQYLAAKIAEAPGKKIVAVVGAGHVAGIKKWIDKKIDTEALEVIPPPKLLTRIIGWGIPLLLVALIAYGFIDGGMEQGIEKIYIWLAVTSITAAFGSILALAHPLTVLTSFIVAPLTTIHPLLASGWFAGLAEASIRKPRVSDLENIAEDVTTLKGVWRNRVSKILLVVILTNLTGSLGTFLALYLLS
ncbi:MAG: TraB/GumN family protein [Bdellovibrionota bacterium]